MSLAFPTAFHRDVADLTRDFFAGRPEVDTALVVNSCARGRATADSDVDMAILVGADISRDSIQRLEAEWEHFKNGHPIVAGFRRQGRFTQLHVDVIDGRFAPLVWDDGGGPDDFEIEIGNRLAYSVPLGAAGPRFAELRAMWLPYYAETLRQQRLTMVRDACAYDLEYVHHCVRRGLHVQGFDRLYKAFREFLQALFIAHRRYPLAYNKWIREQLVEGLVMPDVFRALINVLAIHDLEGDGLIDSAAAIGRLLPLTALQRDDR